MKDIMENFRNNVINEKIGEARGSTAGEGMPLKRAFEYAIEYAASKGQNFSGALGHAQKVRLRNWVRDNVANENMSDPVAEEAIRAAIDSKVAYR
tara:strand:- start:243 stop:527 length:285 start_codon:yes stop_codon:yes gene_type:complete